MQNENTVSKYAVINNRRPEELQDHHRKLADLACKALNGGISWEDVLKEANEQNIQDTDTLGNTALHYACEIGSSTLNPLKIDATYIITTFIELGAKLTQKGDGNETPLRILVKKDRLGILLNLLNKNNVHMIDDLGFTAMDYACEYDNDQIAAELVALGVKLTKKNHHDLTPLCNILLHKRSKCIKKFINQNNINDRDELNKTAIHHICEFGYIKIFKSLLILKPNFSIQDGQGQTPLHLATLHGHLEIVKELCLRSVIVASNSNDNNNQSSISLKNDIRKIQDNDGNLALHYAVKLNRIEMVKLLNMSRNLNNVPNNNGETPLQLATGKEELLQALAGYTRKGVLVKNSSDPSPAVAILAMNSNSPHHDRRRRSRSFNEVDKQHIKSIITFRPEPSTTQTPTREESETNPLLNRNPKPGK